MKNKDEILRKFDEAIQYFINCSENLPGTTFCSNVDKLIDIKCDIANGFEQSESTCNLQNVSKRFLVTYRYTNKTDAALHEDEVIAENCVEACNIVCSNHGWQVEWHTVKEKN